MKKFFLFALAAMALVTAPSCTKDGVEFGEVSTPRTNPVPDELIGRWAIIGISGSTVYNVPAGSTYNTSEWLLGYQINKDGTIREDGYLATYQYGVSTWAKWTAYGSVKLEGSSVTFHRNHGSYTSSRNSAATEYGPSEVYPNKSVRYEGFELGTDGRGNPALLLTGDDGSVRTFVKQ